METLTNAAESATPIFDKIRRRREQVRNRICTTVAMIDKATGRAKRLRYIDRARAAAQTAHAATMRTNVRPLYPMHDALVTAEERITWDRGLDGVYRMRTAAEQETIAAAELVVLQAIGAVA